MGNKNLTSFSMSKYCEIRSTLIISFSVSVNDVTQPFNNPVNDNEYDNARPTNEASMVLIECSITATIATAETINTPNNCNLIHFEIQVVVLKGCCKCQFLNLIFSH